MKIEEMKIEKNIPLPTRRTNGVYFISKMEVGDSVFNTKRSYSAFTIMARRNGLDFEFTERSVAGGFRLWRTK